MTLEAGVRLERRLQLELERHFFHDRVAIGAGYVARFMRAAAPIGPLPLLVAAETDGVVLLDCAGGIIAPEGDDPTHATSALSLDMGRARTVAADVSWRHYII